MTSRHRLLRFSLVGAIGIAVQLGVLAALVAMKMNYLLATGLAVEAAVLHNFLWHQRFTWADRAGRGVRAAFAQLLRFHLSNGLISMLGNLLLMRLFAGSLRLPVLPSNLVTIALCFVANYLASDRWVFLSHASYEGTTSVVPQRSLPNTPLGADLVPVAHQQQSALGKGKIDQGGSGGESQAHPDLRRQQKRREGPELIKDENSGEQSKKFPAEALHIERRRRQQIQANRDADRCRHYQDGCDPSWTPECMLQQFLDRTQPGQGADVEAEIQNLNQHEKEPYVTMRNRRQVLGTSEQEFRNCLGGASTWRFGG